MLSFLSIVLIVSSANALLPSSQSRSRNILRMSADPSSLLVSLLQKADKQQATAEFYFFFFGGSGALGIGGAQVPKLLAQNKLLQSKKGGRTLGGADLGASPLATFGYPESIKYNDIESIIKTFPTVEKISSLGPKNGYMAQLGYLEREGLEKALPNANPVALYAIFDALSEGGGDLASPTIAAALVQSWKAPGGIDKFKNALLLANSKKLVALSFFAFLILLVIDLVAESAQYAFF